MNKKNKESCSNIHHESKLALTVLFAFLIFTLLITFIFNIQQKPIYTKTKKDTSYNNAAALPEPTVPEERYSPFLEDKIPMDKEMFLYTVETAEEYGLEPELVFAVMNVESNFDFHARSEDGSCIGIMQVHEINYEELRNRIFITNLGNPYENIKAGCFILSELLEKYPLERALVCYNCGENGCKAETTEYSQKVIEIMMQYQ